MEYRIREFSFNTIKKMIKDREFFFNSESYKHIEVISMINANLPLDIIYATENKNGALTVFKNSQVIGAIKQLEESKQINTNDIYKNIILRLVVIKEGAEDLLWIGN